MATAYQDGTGYVHFPGSSVNSFQNGPNNAPFQTMLQRWAALAAQQPQNSQISPWASAIQYLTNQPATRTVTSTAAATGVPGSGSVTVAPSTGTGVKTLWDQNNPWSTLSTPKSESIAGVTGPLFQDWQNLRTGVQANNQEFNKAYGEFLPKSRAMADQESGVVSRYFDGQITKDLEDLRAATSAARESALTRALGDARKGLNISGLATPTGTGGSVGPSSYRARQEMDVASRLRTDAAMQEAEQRRNDFAFEESAKQALLDRRRQMELAQIQDILFPQQANVASFNALTGAATPVANMDLANNFYGIAGPQGFVGDSFGQIQESKLRDLARQAGVSQFYDNLNQNAQQFATNTDLNLIGIQNQIRDLNLREAALTRPQSGGNITYNFNNADPRTIG